MILSLENDDFKHRWKIGDEIKVTDFYIKHINFHHLF